MRPHQVFFSKAILKYYRRLNSKIIFYTNARNKNCYLLINVTVLWTVYYSLPYANGTESIVMANYQILLLINSFENLFKPNKVVFCRLPETDIVDL